MQSSKSYPYEHSKSELSSPGDKKSNKIINASLLEGDKQNSNISLQEQVSSNLANPTNNPTEISESYTNLPFRDMGKVSFHIRDRISVIIASITYTTLEFIDHFTNDSDIGKEFIKYVIKSQQFFIE